MKNARFLIALATSAALAGCGLRGGLERPEPLVGNPPVDGPSDPRVLDESNKKPAPEPAPAPVDDADVPDDELLGGL